MNKYLDNYLNIYFNDFVDRENRREEGE